MEKVIFTLEETDEKIEFFIQEETQLNGVKYLLVSENELPIHSRKDCPDKK